VNLGRGALRRDGVPGVSIVIPVVGQLDLTRRCVESIRACTDLPYEVIVVDNASTDGSAEWCEAAGCRVLRNRENAGCAGSWNQGIRAARYPLLLVTNNDVVVTPGWLDGLTAYLPESGCGVASPSVIEGRLDYDLHGVAETYSRRMAGRSRPGWHPSCFLVRRETLEVVGLFDERFRGGGYEDDDFDIRLGLAGIRTGTTGAALVHHYGQITQKAVAGSAWKAAPNPNRAVLEARWGWRLILRRGRKELRRSWERLRYRGTGGRDPRDAFLVRAGEGLDLDRMLKYPLRGAGERVRTG